MSDDVTPETAAARRSIMDALRAHRPPITWDDRGCSCGVDFYSLDHVADAIERELNDAGVVAR